MRALIGIVLTLGLLVSSISGVAAQQSGVGFASGLNQPVAYADEDGVTATLTVNAIHDEFTDYPQNAAPDYGYRYVLVEFTIQNQGELSAEIGWHKFFIMSDYGRSHSAQYMEIESDDFTLLTEDVSLSPAESITVAQVFAIPAHAQPAFFTWAWSTDYQVAIDLGAEPQDRSAFAYGPDSAAVYTDDFGNPVASMQVNSIDTELEGYSATGMEEGDTFAAAHITLTNLTDRDVSISSLRFDMLDASGNYLDSSYLRAEEGVEPEPFRGELFLAPGESVDIMIAFNITGSTEILGVRWMPNWRDTTIHFVEEQGSQIPATPEATPAVN